MRSTIPDGIARVLFAVHGPSMVLLHGFVKKSAEAPATDMKIARDRLRKLED